MNRDDLWAEVFDQLKHHQKRTDCTPLEALNRILGYYKISGTPHVDPAQVAAIERKSLSRKEVELIETLHERSEPYVIRRPVVIVRYGGGSYIVDGNKRVNYWLASGETELDVIEITI